MLFFPTVFSSKYKIFKKDSSTLEMIVSLNDHMERALKKQGISSTKGFHDDFIRKGLIRWGSIEALYDELLKNTKED
jgi:hypothetical protein